MRPIRTLLAALAVAGLTLPALSAQAQAEADKNAQGSKAQDAQPDKPGEVTIGEKASDVDPLKGKKPAVPVAPERRPEIRQVEGILGVPAMEVKIDPRVLGVAPGEPLPRLRREGEALRQRSGRLLPTGDRGYAVFIMDPKPDSKDKRSLAMVIAPCMTLESMERLLEDRGENLRFTITGEVHTYRGVNYLLPTSQPKPFLVQPKDDGEVVKSKEGDDKTPGKTTNKPGAETDTKPDADAKAKEDDIAKQDGKDSKGAGGKKVPTTDEVLKELLKERKDAPDTTGLKTKNKDPKAGSKKKGPAFGKRKIKDTLLMSLDPNQAQAKLKDEGQFVIARAGRLVRSADGAQALFVFDADAKGAPEAPMIVQACKLLELMEKTVREQGDNAPFVVTGQVYMYRGANYLLPTIVKREFDRGNLE